MTLMKACPYCLHTLHIRYPTKDHTYAAAILTEHNTRGGYPGIGTTCLGSGVSVVELDRVWQQSRKDKP